MTAAAAWLLLLLGATIPIQAVEKTGLRPALALNSVSTYGGYRINGTTAGSGIGHVVAGIGDFNGDGYGDVAVTAPNARRPAGATVFVIFGTAAGHDIWLDPTVLDGRNGFRIEGVGQGAGNSLALAGAGDINGDGADDLIVGTGWASPDGRKAAGCAYVIFGSELDYEPAVNLGALSGRNGFRLDGAASGERSGSAVAGAGDINGDGIGDVIIGAPGANRDAGASYLVLGRTTGFPGKMNLSDLNATLSYRIDGGWPGSGSGASVGGAGDFNGDGLDDVIVGSSAAQSAFLVFGNRAVPKSAINLASLNGKNGFRLDGALAKGGLVATGAGDFNGDSFDDVIIAASSAGSGPKQSSGTVYLVFGKSSGFSLVTKLSSLKGVSGIRMKAARGDTSAGIAVSTAGDFNGDGTADILIGTAGADPGGRTRAGSSYVIFGGTENSAAAIDMTAIAGSDGLRIDGGAPGDRSGGSAAAAGDVNGDGVADIIIGAHGADPYGKPDAGVSYVVYGRASWSVRSKAPSVWENLGAIDLTIARTTSANAATVFVSTTEAEGFSNADDYAAINGQALTFAAGEKTKTLSIRVNDDISPEGDETFGVVVRKKSGRETGGDLAKSAFTIINDDLATMNSSAAATRAPMMLTIKSARDTQLRRSAPRTSFGGYTSVTVDRSDGLGAIQGLLYFNVIGSGAGQVPLGSNIHSATLTLQTNNGGSGGAFHRMLKSWGESATWNLLTNGIQTDGIDARIAADLKTGAVPVGKRSFNLTSSVAAWSAGAPNYGWVIKPLGKNGWAFSSREATSTARPSLTISYTPADVVAPSVPTNLIGSAPSSSRVNLSWTASSDNKAVAGYKVYRNGGATPIATVSGTSYSNTGLSASTTYSYTVAAFDATGNHSAKSSPAAEVTTQAPDTAPPSVPTGLAGTAVSATRIDLTWSASSDNIAVAGYRVYRDGGSTPIATVTGTSYSNTGLAANTAYSYTVAAFDASGNASEQSLPAGPITTDMPDTESPSTPTGLSGTAVSSTRIDLNWSESTDNIGVSGYKVFRNGSGTPVATVTGTSYSDTGRSASTTYSYRVLAFDAAGNNSAQSAPALEVTTPASNGTRRVPQDYATIQAAINAAQDGNTVLVAPGTYPGGLSVSGKTISIVSYFHTTGDTAYINNTIISGGSPGIQVSASAPNVLIKGFHFVSGTPAGYQLIFRGAGGQANNNIFDSSGGDALSFESVGGTARNNTCFAPGDDCIDIDDPTTDVVIEGNYIDTPGNDGLELRNYDYDGPLVTVTIRGNTFIGAKGDGVQLIDYPANSKRKFVIERNLFRNNQQVGLGLMDNGETNEDYRAASMPERIEVFNNTFHANRYAITGGDNLIAVNNIVSGSTVQGFKNINGSSIVSHTLFWNNLSNQAGSNMTAATTYAGDPLYTASFGLGAGSPAIDAGTASFSHNSQTVLTIPPSEFAGSAPDLGQSESGL